MNPVRVYKDDVLRLEPCDEVRLIRVVSFQERHGSETVTLEMLNEDYSVWGVSDETSGAKNT